MASKYQLLTHNKQCLKH